MSLVKRPSGDIIAQLKANHATIPIIAVHEAGHVVGRYLTAGTMGVAPAKSVCYVQMHPSERALTAGGMLSHDAARTVGPTFSAEIDAVSKNLDTPQRLDAVADDRAVIVDPQHDAAAVIGAALAAGVTVRSWAVSKIVQYVAGPAAEARFRWLSFDKLTGEPGCRSDLTDAARIATLAGLSDQQLTNAINNSARWLNDYWDDPCHWEALLTLAQRLPREGRMEGGEVWRIYAAALANHDGA